MKLILVIDWVGALKSQLMRGIEFSGWNQWLVFTETASQKVLWLLMTALEMMQLFFIISFS